MGITLTRAVGIKAGETVLTEEQILSGYETDIRYPTGLNFVRYDAIILADDYGVARDLAATHYGIILYAFEAAQWFKLSPDNSSWSAGIYVPKNVVMGFDVQVRYWTAKRNVSGVGTYGIIYTQKII